MRATLPSLTPFPGPNVPAVPSAAPAATDRHRGGAVAGCGAAIPEDRSALKEDVHVKLALRKKRRRNESVGESLDVDSL